MYIVVDFDGTCVTHDFPAVGKDIGAVPVLKQLTDAGHKLILFTMRSDKKAVEVSEHDKSTGVHPVAGQYLTEAVNWFKENDIPLYGIQTNPTQKHWTESPKAYGELIIDDAALGAPLKFNRELSGRPFICWSTVESYLKNRNII